MTNEQGNSGLWHSWKLDTEQAFQEYTSTNEIILVAILKGSVDVYWSGTKHTIREKEMCLLPAGSMCRYKAKGNVRGISYRFRLELLSDFFSMQDLRCLCGRNPEWITIANINEICFSFLQMLEYYPPKGVEYTQMQGIKCREFLHLLNNIYNKVELAEFLRPIINERTEFRSFIIRNWNKARNVEELAAMASLSTSGFKKKFKRYFDQSPYNWILQQKRESVFTEIVAGDSPLKAIAVDYHFASYAHFCTFCRTHYGRSASELKIGRLKVLPQNVV